MTWIEVNLASLVVGSSQPKLNYPPNTELRPAKLVEVLFMLLDEIPTQGLQIK